MAEIDLSLGAEDIITEVLDADIYDYLDFNTKYLIELEPVYRKKLLGKGNTVSHIRLFAKKVEV